MKQAECETLGQQSSSMKSAEVVRLTTKKRQVVRPQTQAELIRYWRRWKQPTPDPDPLSKK